MSHLAVLAMLDDIYKVMKPLKTGKASCADDIPTEVYKHGGPICFWDDIICSPKSGTRSRSHRISKMPQSEYT